MDSAKYELVSNLSHLDSQDEKEFYQNIAKHFHQNAKEYHGKFTVIFFSGDDGVFAITRKVSFKNYKELKNFHNKVGRRNYHFILGPYKEGFKFIFNGKFQFGVEIFGVKRKIIYLEYDQLLKDVVEGRKTLPPPSTALGDMIVKKLLEQIAGAKPANKRKLAS